MLRLVLVSANIFLLLHTFQAPVISIDYVLFALFSIYINIRYALPLLEDKLPVNMKSEEQIVFKDVFKSKLSPLLFSKLIQIKSRRVINVSSNLCRISNGFDGVMFIASKSQNCKVVMENKIGDKFELEAYEWIGLGEYLNKRKDNESDTFWLNSVHVKVKEKEEIFQEDSLTESLLSSSDTLVIWHFEYDVKS